MKITRNSGLILFVVTLIALTSCGGGGGGDDGGGRSSSSSSSSAGSGSVNTPPEFTSAASAEIVENSKQTGYTATAQDDDADSLTFSIVGGVDQALFSIDSHGGDLSFVDPPDYEMPADSDANNNYVVELEVSDGNGGGSELSVTISVTDVERRTVFTVDYPTPNADVGGEEQTTVAGTIAEKEGDVVERDFSDVTFIDVNGRLATPSPDNPTRWTAQVPIGQPSDTLDVSMEWASGGSDSVGQGVSNRALLLNPRAAVYDGGGHLLVVDDELGALIEIDINTGARRVISDAYTGDGPIFDEPQAIALDFDDGYAYVADPGIAALFKVNLSNGDRTILSGAGQGSGPAIVFPRAVVLDGGSSRLLVMDRGSFSSTPALFGVSLNDGQRTVLSDVDHGSGANFDNPSSIAFDASQNRVLVVEPISGVIVQADLSNNGDRTVFSGDGIGDGEDFNNPQAIVIDGNRALVTDNSSGVDKLRAVSLSNGDRNVVLDIGMEPDSGVPRFIALDATNDQAWFVDTGYSKILSMDLNSGSRAVLADARVNNGEAFVNPESVALDTAENRILVVDWTLDALIAVDMANGSRSVVSGLGIGEGPDFALPRSVVLDELNNRALVVDAASGKEALLAVDLKTGDREELSGPNKGKGTDPGSGPDFAAPRSVAVDASGDRAWVADTEVNHVVEVDLVTGDRSRMDVYLITATGSRQDYSFSSVRSVALDKDNNRLVVADGGVHEWLVVIDTTTGRAGLRLASEPGYVDPEAVALDPVNNRALVVDPELGALVSVDLDSGNGIVISGPGTGAGPNFIAPESVAMDAGRRRAFVVDSSLGAVLVIDLSTGDRAVVSK